MTALDVTTSYRFGRFELQLGERWLLADGVVVSLGPRGFDLLVALVEQAGHLVTKDALFSRVWPKVVVDDSALQFQISALRKVVGADAITTVSGRGYRFVLPVVRTGSVGAHGRKSPLHNLPQALPSFVGRERDVVRLRQLLDRARLVTLTGAGGCGKTRLAIEVAAGAVHRYADGAWLVELGALTDPSHVLQEVMGVLGAKEAPGTTPLDALMAHIGTRRLLLLLDNAEHLLPACTELVDHLLQGCAGVNVLVTSRQALGVVGEQTYRVPSLSVPDIQQRAVPAQLLACESARLFVERARALRPHFAVTPQNAEALALLCWRLDGIPLAIELAAGRIRAMSVEELSQRLNQRFSLLSGGSHAVLPRHRTLRSLIDWSYDLLPQPEQDLLCRLSVFAGGCTLHAAEHVCCDDGADAAAAARVLDLLAALSDKNLVVADEHDGATRYRLLETVRQYARERLQEKPVDTHWQERHWAYFFGMAKDALPHNHGPDQQVWFDKFEADTDNLRAALNWSMVAGRTGEGLRLAGRLSHFWMVRGYLTEAMAWYATLLAVLPADHAAEDRGIALSLVGTMATLQGDCAAARVHCEEALQLFRGLGDRLRIACTLNNLGSIAETEGDFAAATGFIGEAITMFRDIGHASNLARALVNLGNVVRCQGDLAHAQTVLSEGLAIARQVGARQAEATALSHLGSVAILDGRLADARALLDAALAIFADIGDRTQAVDALEDLAYLDARAGGGRRSAQLWGAAEQLRDVVGLVRPVADVDEHARRVAAGRAAMGDEAAFDRAWQDGLQLTFKQAIDLAVAPQSA